MYPASYNNVVSVAASAQGDSTANFSNYGPAIDVTAPGVGIYSTVVGGTGYANESGTSMACPMVSGLAALLLSSNPALTVDEVIDCITTTADNITPKTLATLAIWALDASTHRRLCCALSWWPPAFRPTLPAFAPGKACSLSTKVHPVFKAGCGAFRAERPAAQAHKTQW